MGCVEFDGLFDGALEIELSDRETLQKWIWTAQGELERDFSEIFPSERQPDRRISVSISQSERVFGSRLLSTHSSSLITAGKLWIRRISVQSENHLRA